MVRNRNRSSSDGAHLQVVIETAAEVHLSERHVRQLGVKEDPELGADVQRRPPGRGLLLGGDVDPGLVEVPQMFLQGEAHAGLHQAGLGGAASSHRGATYGSAQAV